MRGENLTTEWCPICEQEVDILDDRPSKCPGHFENGKSCMHVIIPCSTCEFTLNSTCDWNEYTRCKKYPAENKERGRGRGEGEP